MLTNSAIIAGLLLLAGCGASTKFKASPPPPNDMRPVPAPESREINLAADNMNKLVTIQVQRFFDLARHYRSITNNPRQAKNINEFDEVYNSSWFTNRNGMTPLTLEAIARGPNQVTGPDTLAEWVVVAAKTQGVTPGFTIKDTTGQRYVIKFDPMGYPQLATGAEAVSTKLFYAAGYNVPENYLVKFDPKILRVGDEVKFLDKEGVNRFMNEDDLNAILERIQKLPDGRIRVIASKFLSGKPLGSFYYMKTRKDDANDVIDHEYRRELRGLRVIASWLNHFDTKANNTLDMYDPAGYVKHYLIDFGSTLGSQGDEPMPPEIGREGPGDPGALFKTIGSLGTHQRSWEKDPNIVYPSIGYMVSHDFEPQKYKFILPNPAFMDATNRDGYWGAKIVMSFTDDQIRTAVAQGEYSDPEAADYLYRTIIERRNIIGEYWFNRMPPLDKFEIKAGNNGAQMLCFQDLAVKSGLDSPDSVAYQVDVKYRSKALVTGQDLGKETCLPLTELQAKAAAVNAKETGQPDWEIFFKLKRHDEEKWSKWVKVFLVTEDDGNTFKLLGLLRQE